MNSENALREYDVWIPYDTRDFAGIYYGTSYQEAAKSWARDQDEPEYSMTVLVAPVGSDDVWAVRLDIEWHATKMGPG